MDPDVKSDAWFPCYPDDLLGATSHMSNHDFGAYWKMLCWYYKNGPLPNDDDSLRRIGTVERQDWMRTKGIVMAKFVLNGDGKFHQGRADEIIAERNEINRKVAEKSRKGVEARRALGQLPPEPQVEPMVEPQVEPKENQGFNLGRTQPQPQPQPHVQPQPQPKRESVRFAPPTLEEVRLHGSKIGLPEVECQKFLAYYESNGWKVGRNPMKSWPAAMIHWRTNWQEKQHETHHRTGQQNPRNVGVCTGVTDYAAAGRLKAKRDAEESLAREMARNKATPPPA